MGVTIADCSFKKNIARSSEFGGFSDTGGFNFTSFTGQADLDMRRCLFEENSADLNAGFSFFPILGSAGTVYLEDCQILNNTALDCSGGAIFPIASTSTGTLEDTASVAGEIRNCLFQNNQILLPLFGGGALDVGGFNRTSSNLTLISCQFLDNFTASTDYPGAAISIRDNQGETSVQIDSSVFAGNEAPLGGAIGLSRYTEDPMETQLSLHINHSRFSHNTANQGGAIYAANENTGSIEIVLEGDSLTQNRSTLEGGAVYAVNNSSESLEVSSKRSWFAWDSASAGGAIFLENQSTGSSRFDDESSLFLGNHATLFGGASYLKAQDGSIRSSYTNSTLYSNHAGSMGGAISFDQDGAGSGNHSLRNSIFAHNIAGSSDLDLSIQNGAIVIAAGILLQDSSTALPAIVGDPGFIDPLGPDGQAGTGDENLQLDWYSPAINAGFNAFVNSPFDLAGNDRIQRDTVDLGAYESAFITAINDASEAFYQIYPNPATNMLFMKEVGPGRWKLTITDLQGRQLLQQSIMGGTGEIFDIDIQTLAIGTYFITLANQEHQFSHIFLKQ